MRLQVHEFGPGAGRTVIALHGVMGQANVFKRLADRLPDIRLVAPDLRGHGASGKEPPWDISMHLRDLRETLDAMGISRAPFIGFSFGGRLAVELVAADRSRVEKLVLLDPALRMTPETAMGHTDGVLADPSYPSVEEAIAARSLAARYAPPDYFTGWAEDLVAGTDGRFRMPFSRAAAITILSELVTPPPPFDALRIPTLLIPGTESTMITPREIERYKYELGDFLDVKPVRAQHQVIGDAADDVAGAVSAFLAR
jgi:lipase